MVAVTTVPAKNQNPPVTLYQQNQGPHVCRVPSLSPYRRRNNHGLLPPPPPRTRASLCNQLNLMSTRVDKAAFVTENPQLRYCGRCCTVARLISTQKTSMATPTSHLNTQHITHVSHHPKSRLSMLKVKKKPRH
eukprot:GHVN01058466.1.p1 GENE.GHVN01058466.1~~GHVN01058466.1.p1  ORF type:complete len:134 (-),score=7.69 GHVN01058466.1:29-430(-)